MKKYINVYNEATKRSKRIEASKNIGIATKLLANRLDVKFFDLKTGDVKVSFGLCIDVKELEILSQNLIDSKVSFIVEMYMHNIIASEYKEFLNDYRQTLRVNKVGQQWILSLVLFLSAINNDCGEEVAGLAADIKKFYS